MDIYVRSRGHSPDFEYCWQPEVPPHYASISPLIQTESPSVVLARFDQQLLLLVTGLKSPKKSDFRDRPIRHSVTWVWNENDDNEKLIRAITIQALRGLLVNRVDQYIQFGGESGFEASISELERMSHLILNEEEIEVSSLPSSELTPKIGKNSQELRDDIAKKLQQYSLPKIHKLIVVNTGVKSEESLEKAGAWRYLSKQVKSEDWRDLSSREAEPRNFLKAAITIVVAVVVAALMLVVLPPFTQKPGVNPSPSPRMPPTSQEVEEHLPMEQNSLAKGLTSLEKDSLSSEKDSIPLMN